MSIFQYNYPTTIQFGPGARARLADALKSRGLSRPVLVTDRGLASLGFFNDYVESLRKEGLEVAVYSGIWGNPVKSQVDAGVKAAKEAKADAVIAIGGGAALDVGKVIALMLNHPGDLFDYAAGAPNPRPVDQPMPFIAALPTTAGTGSEVGRSSVVSEEDTHVKRVIFNPRLLPQLVLADPELTLELPASVTATTGMDAITHLVEAFISQGFHPMADGIALEGLRLAARSLPVATEYAAKKGDRSEKHVEARGEMMMAALMGAVAFQKGLGVTHSCAHALSTVCDTHHGLANGVLIPYCMEFYLPAAREQFARLAQAVGAKTETAEGFIQWLVELRSKLGIPATLAEIGVKEEHLAKLIPLALKDGCHPEGPRPVSEKDFREIYTNALNGKLTTGGR